MRDLRNYINEAANQHNESVDNDALWAGIEQKMKSPERKRRMLPFWIWGVSFLIVVLVFAFYSLDDNKKLIVDKVDIEPTNIIHYKESSTKYAIDKTEPWIIEENEDVFRNSTPRAQLKKKKGEYVEDYLDITKEKNASSATLNFKLGERRISEFEDQNRGDFNFSENITLIKENAISGKTDLNTGSQLNASIRDFEVIEFSKTISPSNILYARSEIEIPDIYARPSPLRSRRNRDNSILNSIAVYAQYGFGSRTIEGNSIHTIMRNDSEELLEQLRFGIESDLFNVHDFTFYGGISYVSINYRLDVFEEYYDNRALNYLKTIIIEPDGSEIKNYVTEDLPHLIQNKAVRYNSHRLISIPIGLRFGKKISNLNLGVGIGMDFNYQLSNSHSILGLDKKLTTIRVGGKWQSPWFHTAIIAEYPLSERWYLHSKFMYRKTALDNISIGENVKESYKLYGVDLGLKFQF